MNSSRARRSSSKTTRQEPLQLGARKHVFIDDALLAATGDAKFVVNPPRRAERVIDNIKGTFRKHLTASSRATTASSASSTRVEEDHLVVYTSTDGVHFDRPDQGRGEINGHRNIVIPDMVGGLGNPFWDPAGANPTSGGSTSRTTSGAASTSTPQTDGYDWTRRRNIILPFRSGTQSSTYYDDQRQVYMAYHRSGIFHTPGGDDAAQFGGHGAQGPARDLAVRRPSRSRSISISAPSIRSATRCPGGRTTAR